ncbi:MAG: formylmethanofuran dehydrogenase subunit C [Methylophaga sp.]|jgi:formylmethanofuran dehydrogenase subunit C|nr:formylmethanofuran dehydrogenase subunit C [Methylophaga sp.]
MSELILTLKSAPAQRVDCSPLTVDKLEGKSVKDIAALTLVVGNQKLRVDELFDIDGDDPAVMRFENATDKLDHIGHGMTTGTITVNGNAGAYLGQFMMGGEIIVNGNTGIYTACEMKKGFIKVNGNAGDFVGAARIGYKNGMTGGTVVITGNTGARTGDHMRRGMILIEGNAGDYCGSRMVSGTIAVLGQVGAHLGYAMKRGTLLLQQAPEKGISANFNDCGSHTLAFLPLMFASFRKLDSEFARVEPFSRVQRYAGDLSGIGMGEILVKI